MTIIGKSRAERLADAARETVEQVREAGEHSAAGARNEIGDFVDEVLELLGGARNWEQEELVQLRKRLHGSAERLKDGAQKGQRELRAAAESAAATADDYAHDNPWQVAAVAAAVGVVLGVLISRR
jgi:ElaB/YqjD/DUF883 family membrane-anchored ribosome-binding protein